MTSDHTDDAIYRAVLEESPEAVVFADRNGIVWFWNRGATELFGYTAEETIGQRMDMIIPENLRARHWDGYERVMVRGKPSRYGRSDMLKVPALRKDGTRVSVEFTLLPIEHPPMARSPSLSSTMPRRPSRNSATFASVWRRPRPARGRHHPPPRSDQASTKRGSPAPSRSPSVPRGTSGALDR